MKEGIPLPEEILPPDDLEAELKLPKNGKGAEIDGSEETKEENENLEPDAEQIEKRESLEAHENSIIELYKKRDAEKEDLKNHDELIRKLDEICGPNVFMTSLVTTLTIGRMIGHESPQITLLGLIGLVTGGLAAYSAYKSGKLSFEQEEKKEEMEKNIEKLEEQIKEEDKKLSGGIPPVEEKS